MWRSLLTTGFLLLLAIGCFCGWLWHDYQSALQQPLALGDEPVLYNVASGMTFRGVAGDLKQRGWWKHPRYFMLEAYRRGLQNKLKTGEYELQVGVTLDQLLELLASGKTVQHPLTIVEGWTFSELRHALEQSAVLQNTLRGVDDATVMERIGFAGIYPEGRFFPDTYHVTRGTTDVALLKRAYQRMAATLDALWKERAADLPYQSPDEALVMASIVEKETAVAQERAQIASVFVERLKRGMKLQTDPTVIYGLGANFDGNLRRKHLEADTPYNTYTRAGLPPTPVAMPGQASLIAALHPAGGEALYFVARGDGSHEFSRTLEEHNRAVTKYQLRSARSQQ